MALDVAALVAPLDDASPSGPDLGYDDGRVAIEAAFERSISVDTAAEDDATDWRQVIARILAQAEQTRDLWLPVYLMRAAAASRQFDLVVDGAELLAGLVEERWPDVHPQLDEYGFIGRKTPCESLTRLGDFLGPLARVPLIEHPRLGRFSGEDLIRFADQGAGADGYGMFRRVIDDMAPEELEATLDRVDALATALRRTDGVMTANAEGDTATNFKPTYDLLGAIRAALAAHVPGAQPAASPAGTEPVADQAGTPVAALAGAAPAGEGFTGAIRNRQDVIRAIDAIGAYYAAVEPGSPVPLALARARDWIGLDFMAVLQDIAPNAIGEASVVLRPKRAEEAPAAGGGWDEQPAAASDDSGW